jgi:hypothetical protein
MEDRTVPPEKNPCMLHRIVLARWQRRHQPPGGQAIRGSARPISTSPAKANNEQPASSTHELQGSSGARSCALLACSRLSQSGGGKARRVCADEINRGAILGGAILRFTANDGGVTLAGRRVNRKRVQRLIHGRATSKSRSGTALWRARFRSWLSMGRTTADITYPMTRGLLNLDVLAQPLRPGIASVEHNGHLILPQRPLKQTPENIHAQLGTWTANRGKITVQDLMSRRPRVHCRPVALGRYR